MEMRARGKKWLGFVEQSRGKVVALLPWSAWEKRCVRAVAQCNLSASLLEMIRAGVSATFASGKQGAELMWGCLSSGRLLI